MIRAIVIAILSFSLMGTSYCQGCTTILESIENASAIDLCKEYNRLQSYKNPYCDTTGSVFHDVMNQLQTKAAAEHLTKEDLMSNMGSPYYHGPLSEYEKQKVTVGRNGKKTGVALPPAYKIPTGDYYVVYLWRNKDYLVFALKGNQVTEARWWEKGNFR